MLRSGFPRRFAVVAVVAAVLATAAVASGLPGGIGASTESVGHPVIGLGVLVDGEPEHDQAHGA